MHTRIAVAASTLWFLSTLAPLGALANNQVNALPAYARSEIRYDIPNVTLTNAEGNPVSLLSELVIDKPVLVNFIFTSCTSFCPLLTATLAKVQETLQKRGEVFRMISISIDPEHDTPARLQAYAQRYRAPPDWHFLTGDISSTLAVQRAFDAYRGGKMNHASLTLMRLRNGGWLRFEGLIDAETLIREFTQDNGS